MVIRLIEGQEWFCTTAGVPISAVTPEDLLECAARGCRHRA